jgi:hypothetical protein
VLQQLVGQLATDGPAIVLVALVLVLTAPIVALLIARKHGDVDIKIFGFTITVKGRKDDHDDEPPAAGRDKPNVQ